MPKARAKALITLCRALADGDIALDRGPDRDDVSVSWSACRDRAGTADYIALRALGHPDVFLPTDVGIRHAMTQLGLDPVTADEASERWRPWRSYAQMHLWQTITSVVEPVKTKEN